MKRDKDTQVPEIYKNSYFWVIFFYVLGSLMMGGNGFSETDQPSAANLGKWMAEAFVMNLYPLVMVCLYLYSCDRFLPDLKKLPAFSSLSDEGCKRALAVLFFVVYVALGAKVFNLYALFFAGQNL